MPDGDELDRLVSCRGDQERAAADLYVAVLGWLGMAVWEESTWRRVKLRGAAAEGCCGPPAARGAVRAVPSSQRLGQ